MKGYFRRFIVLYLVAVFLFGHVNIGEDGANFKSSFIVSSKSGKINDIIIDDVDKTNSLNRNEYKYVPRYEPVWSIARMHSLIGISTEDPTVDISVERVNHFDISKVTSSSKVINNGDGTLTIAPNSYQCTVNNTFGELCPELKAGDIVTFTIDTDGACQIYLVGANQLITAKQNNGKGVVLTEEMLSSKVSFYGVPKNSEDYAQKHIIYGVQVEKGTERTNREEYLSDISNIDIVFNDGVNSTTLKTQADGSVGSVTAVSTTATITSNNFGINIFCEYMKKQVSVVALGDSIVFGMNPNIQTSSYYEGYEDMNGQHISYMALACDKLGYNFVNYGISASTVARKDDVDSSSSMALRFSSMPDDADLVYVAGGSNDWYSQMITIGTNEDREVTTFYGALHVLCQSLKEKYPDSLIVFATPIKRWIERGDGSDGSLNASGEFLDTYCLAIKEVCAEYNIVVHDMYNEVSFDSWNESDRATYTPDGIHPNLAGHKIMQIEVEEFLLPIFGHNKSGWIVDESASCISNGFRHKECVYCGELYETEVIFATGHIEETLAATEPTCTKPGLSVGSKCSLCGEVLIPQTETAPSKGHTEGEWIIDKEVTCTSNGSKHKECTVCGDTLETSEIVAIEHVAGEWIVDIEATASAPGEQHKECGVCGITVEMESIPQLKPATPKGTSTNAIGGIQITWNKVDGAVKYTVFRRKVGETNFTNIGTATGNTFLDKNVVSGTFYCYTVRAYNSADGYSAYVYANTSTRKYMATPKLTIIYNHQNGLAIKWNAVAGVTNGYRVYRRGAGQTTWTYLGTTKNLYFIDSAVKNKNGEYFRYTVIADGGYHSKFDTTGLYLRRLANPTLNSATSTSAGITVKWGKVAGSSGYYVYRKTANSTWTRVGVVSGVNNLSYLDKTAKKGTTYTYTVRAVYGSTLSSYYSGISCKDRY